MVTYIYFVKCPNCEDEHFDFFDEAKEFALGCLSQKPIITQTEVCRNDFGECTDSADLGTVWSWEDMMGEDGYTEAEPTVSVFTKDDLKLMADSKDPEFDELDNSVDPEVEEPVTSEVSPVDEIPDNFRKPIPEGMTIEELVEEMEENEDTVECTWCNDLFDKSECRKEVDLGWLCSRCEAAIKSRGETLTFRENNYWDFLDEDADALKEASLSDIAAAANSEFGSSWNSEDLLDMSGVEDDFRRTDTHTGMTPSEKAKYEREQAEEKAYKAKLASWKKYQKSKQEDLDPEELHDLGDEYDGGYPATQTWVCYFDGVDIGTVEAATEDEALEKMQQEYPEYPYGLRKHDDCWWVEPAADNALDLDFPEA